VPDKLGSWTPYEPTFQQPGGDYTFIKETVENMGGPIWRDEIIAVLRPDLQRPYSGASRVGTTAGGNTQVELAAAEQPVGSGVALTIVTPWYGHPELAEDYVSAVQGELRPGDDVLIVDNGGAPDLPFRRLTPTTNLGFSAGCNLGLDHAATEAVLFLNNDIVWIARGWLAAIRSLLAPGALVGEVRDHDGTEVDGERYPYIDGWCLAGMTDDLRELGGFDEQLDEPAYYSDNILCLEARAAGMELRDARILLRHKQNITAGPAWDARVRAATQSNRIRYEARVRELTAVVP
jgi:GT2 family glycosyltransferase